MYSQSFVSLFVYSGVFSTERRRRRGRKKRCLSLPSKKKNRLKKNLSQKSRETLFEPTKDKEIISLSGSKQQNRLLALC